MFLVAHNRIYESSDRIAVVNEIKSSISKSYLGLYSFRFPVGVFLLFWSILRRYIFPIISLSHCYALTSDLSLLLEVFCSFNLSSASLLFLIYLFFAHNHKVEVEPVLYILFIHNDAMSSGYGYRISFMPIWFVFWSKFVALPFMMFLVALNHIFEGSDSIVDAKEIKFSVSSAFNAIFNVSIGVIFSFLFW